MTKDAVEITEQRALDRGWKYVDGYWVLGDAVVLRGIPKW